MQTGRRLRRGLTANSLDDEPVWDTTEGQPETGFYQREIQLTSGDPCRDKKPWEFRWNHPKNGLSPVKPVTMLRPNVSEPMLKRVLNGYGVRTDLEELEFTPSQPASPKTPKTPVTPQTPHVTRLASNSESSLFHPTSKQTDHQPCSEDANSEIPFRKRLPDVKDRTDECFRLECSPLRHDRKLPYTSVLSKIRVAMLSDDAKEQVRLNQQQRWINARFPSVSELLLRTINDVDRTKFTALFRLIDTRNTGKLFIEDLVRLVRSMGGRITLSQICKALQKFGTYKSVNSNNLFLTLDEFCSLLTVGNVTVRVEEMSANQQRRHQLKKAFLDRGQATTLFDELDDDNSDDDRPKRQRRVARISQFGIGASSRRRGSMKSMYGGGGRKSISDVKRAFFRKEQSFANSKMDQREITRAERITLKTRMISEKRARRSILEMQPPQMMLQRRDATLVSASQQRRSSLGQLQKFFPFLKEEEQHKNNQSQMMMNSRHHRRGVVDFNHHNHNHNHQSHHSQMRYLSMNELIQKSHAKSSMIGSRMLKQSLQYSMGGKNYLFVGQEGTHYNKPKSPKKYIYIPLTTFILSCHRQKLISELEDNNELSKRTIRTTLTYVNQHRKISRYVEQAKSRNSVVMERMPTEFRNMTMINNQNQRSGIQKYSTNNPHKVTVDLGMHQFREKWDHMMQEDSQESSVDDSITQMEDDSDNDHNSSSVPRSRWASTLSNEFQQMHFRGPKTFSRCKSQVSLKQATKMLPKLKPLDRL